MKKMHAMSFKMTAFCGFFFSCAAAHAVTSTFDTGAEGWTVAGDVAEPVQWFAEGGNPGGHIRAVDAVIGGVTYFQAPEAYLGDQSGAINTNLSFDLQQTISNSPNQFNDSDVVLVGGGLTLAFDTAMNPNIGSWSRSEVPLTASLWHVSTLAGPVATDEQFSQVLSNLDALHIRAEYQTGADTGYLDNVSLVPEPQSWAMLLCGVGMIVLTGRFLGSGAVVGKGKV